MTSPIFGLLADRGRRTVLITIGIVVWSAATIASGLAHDKTSLFIARAFVGVGEASYATIAPTIIDDLAPPEKKGKWLAVFYSAIPVGSALGYVVGGKVGHLYGWNDAFFVAGAPGLVLAVLTLFMFEPARKTATPRESPLVTIKSLLPFPTYWRSVFGYAAFTFAMGGFAFWAPKYLIKTYGLDLDVANGTFGKITVVTGFIGAFVGGWLGDRAAKKDRGGATPARTRRSGSAHTRKCPSDAFSSGVAPPRSFFAARSPEPTADERADETGDDRDLSERAVRHIEIQAVGLDQRLGAQNAKPPMPNVKAA